MAEYLHSEDRNNILLENSNTSPPDQSTINHFCNSMPLEMARNHFIVLTKNKSKNNQPFLTDAQFGSFIEKAFLNNPSLPKQALNYGIRERLFIVKLFYQFYQIAVNNYENTSQCRQKYIKLLSDNFINWEYQATANNFGNKVKRDWL
jgi:hypothetical protein